MQVYTFDLHSHRNEFNVLPKDYFERVKTVGLNAIAITEHANIQPRLAYDILAPHCPPEVILIPGSELNCEYGHLLAYGKDPEFYELSELFEKGVKFERCLDIAKDAGVLLSISHPWGFNSDSFGYTLGFERLEELVLEKNVGVEIYNGMIGSLANFIFETGWVKKPVSFLDFFEKNRLARRTGLARLTSPIKNRISSGQRELVERCSKAIELSANAKFVTVGSDAHTANRLGEGILKIKSETPHLTIKNCLSELKNKENIIWSGPLVAEISPGVFERADKPFKNSEIYQGAKYATHSLVRKIKDKVKRRKKKA